MVGDIGNGERYDYTIVGHGVNYAKRMEQCCDFFKIMVSATTKELLRSAWSTRSPVNKKFVQIKHVDELREAFEIDPLARREEEVEWAISLYRRNLGIERRQERFTLPEVSCVEAYSDFGCARITDHSFSGLGVRLSRYLANGCEVTLRLDSTDAVGKALMEQGIQEIVGEVRWSGAHEQGYHHGLILRNLSHRQLTVLQGALNQVGGGEHMPLAM